MSLTIQQVAGSTGASLRAASNWVDVINAACEAFEINNPERQAAFLAQIGHESGSLQFVRELWGPTPAQLGYQGRADLGNVQPGDGYHFRGAGLIETTGRSNFAATRDGLRKIFAGVPDFGVVPDFEAVPDALALPQWAAMSAGWYWSTRGCNALADAGDFETITRRINGGLNGEKQRLALWDGARAQLGAGAGIEAEA